MKRECMGKVSCVAYFLPYMSRDSDRAHTDAKNAALDAELERWLCLSCA